MKNTIPTEYEEQKAFIQWLKLYLPKDIFYFAIPNERISNVQHLAKLKASGVVFGMVDILILHGRLGFGGLAIEMKRTKGGKVSENQKAVHEKLRASNYAVVVCKGAEEAITAVKEYLLGNGHFFGRGINDEEVEAL